KGRPFANLSTMQAALVARAFTISARSETSVLASDAGRVACVANRSKRGGMSRGAKAPIVALPLLDLLRLRSAAEGSGSAGAGRADSVLFRCRVRRWSRRDT